MTDKQTIQLNGQTYESAIGGCADCHLDEVEQACFQVAKLAGGGCCVKRCWKLVENTLTSRIDNVAKV